VLTAFRARGTPKHVLASCSGVIEWSRDVSRIFKCTLSVVRNLLRACGDTTTALRREALFALSLVISSWVTDGRVSCLRVSNSLIHGAASLHAVTASLA